jgi:hypothetical protein
MKDAFFEIRRHCGKKRQRSAVADCHPDTGRLRSAFFGNVSALFGNRSAFIGHRSALYEHVSSFFEHRPALYGDVLAFFGHRPALFGDVLAFIELHPLSEIDKIWPVCGILAEKGWV